MSSLDIEIQETYGSPKTSIEHFYAPTVVIVAVDQAEFWRWYGAKYSMKYSHF